jgi:hypothetical protein
MKKDKMLYYLLSRQTDALGNLENQNTLVELGANNATI